MFSPLPLNELLGGRGGRWTISSGLPVFPLNGIFFRNAHREALPAATLGVRNLDPRTSFPSGHFWPSDFFFSSAPRGCQRTTLIFFGTVKCPSAPPPFFFCTCMGSAQLLLVSLKQGAVTAVNIDACIGPFGPKIGGLPNPSQLPLTVGRSFFFKTVYSSQQEALFEPTA